MDDLIGKTLQNKYFLREIIGHGATSDVYLSWDKLRASELAVKILKQELVGTTKFLDMFQNEAGFMKKLRHDNIVPLYDFGQERINGKNNVFIVMKYIKGTNLRRLLVDQSEGQPLGLFETSQILAALCKALKFAHKSKVLHGDIKAANILIAQNQNSYIHEKDVFLTDFGGARLKSEQEGGGTPVYMAPELFSGGIVTEKTDIYALGITLFEMLSGGQLPFRGDTTSAGRTSRERVAWQKSNMPLPSLKQYNPNLSVSVIAVVEKALNRDPKLRHESIIDVFNEFEYARTTGIPDLSSNSRVQSYCLTDKGRRSSNEDFISFFEPFDSQERKASGYIYIVADGFGGASFGERASKYATEKVLYEYLKHPEIEPGKRLKQVITQANQDIFSYAKNNGIHMATTMTVAVVLSNSLIIANVGDSRVYLIRGNDVRQITRDHSVAGELVRNGEMTEREAMASKIKNRLIRTVGGSEDVQVDIFDPISLTPDDKIILCTDGLTRYVTRTDMVRLASHTSPKQICNDVIAFAKRKGRGGADNISIITVLYEPTTI